MTNCLVITGGSRGIGRETATKFMQHGWKIINLSRKPSDLSGAINISFDLADPKNVNEISAQLQSHLKGNDKICLVHNAATYKRDEISSICIDDLQKMLTVNVITAAMLNQVVIPFMSRESAIVYIGTTLAEKGVPNNASYTISKHAVVGMMRATVQDLAPKGIISCCICPGLVETDMVRENMSEETVASILESSVLGRRLIRAEEMAEAIYFCGTNPLFNGSVLHANLGQQMS